MKFLLVSDIHANLSALESFLDNAEFDEFAVLGDIVGYGPKPLECVMRLSGVSIEDVLGNHDAAVGTGADVGVPDRFRALADESVEWTQGLFTGENRAFLESLPTRGYFDADDRTVFFSHGIPADPLYTPLDPDLGDDEMLAVFDGIEADVFVVGHSHKPFIRHIDEKIVMNPGSLGLPLDGVPQISYAVIEDGDPEIVRMPYDIEKTVSALDSTPLSSESKELLSTMLRTALIPD